MPDSLANMLLKSVGSMPDSLTNMLLKSVGSIGTVAFGRGRVAPIS